MSNKLLKVILLSITSLLCDFAYSQSFGDRSKMLITPFRFPLPLTGAKIEYDDLDKDGDPDILKTVINFGAIGDLPVLWIDDDDDMKWGDMEGDIDSDCLMIDANKDGKYGSEYDVIIDWGDEDKDGNADIQIFAENNSFAQTSNGLGTYMIVVDTDKDKVFNYVNWSELKLKAWDKNGQSHFFEDYLGKSLFLKVHSSTFNLSDVRRGVENPFLFYDPDHDGLTEYTIKLDDRAEYIKNIPPHPQDGKIKEEERGVRFTGNNQYAAISYDMNNDNAPGNEFDLDMTIHFFGEGFSYEDQIHKFKSLKGLPGTDSLFYDPRWRQNDELIYADHESAYNLIFQRGKWDYCWFVFDEDDDCARWERVELYEPLNLFKVGERKGGLDNNRQADCSGDRGEWDADNSGKGNLYLSAFDGRIHLYGAEWGAWRIDQEATYYQGYGGIYNGTKKRDQGQPEKYATIKYEDTDKNGFIDKIGYDLDGDTIFEKTVLFSELGISDTCEVINISKMNYDDYTSLYKKMTINMWKRAQSAIAISKKYGLTPNWYSNLMQPNSLREKYHYSYWLNFYTYLDLLQMAQLKNDQKLIDTIEKAYYSGNWNLLNDN